MRRLLRFLVSEKLFLNRPRKGAGSLNSSPIWRLSTVVEHRPRVGAAQNQAPRFYRVARRSFRKFPKPRVEGRKSPGSIGENYINSINGLSECNGA